MNNKWFLETRIPTSRTEAHKLSPEDAPRTERSSESTPSHIESFSHFPITRLTGCIALALLVGLIIAFHAIILSFCMPKDRKLVMKRNMEDEENLIDTA